MNLPTGWIKIVQATPDEPGAIEVNSGLTYAHQMRFPDHRLGFVQRGPSGERTIILSTLPTLPPQFQELLKAIDRETIFEDRK